MSDPVCYSKYSKNLKFCLKLFLSNQSIKIHMMSVRRKMRQGTVPCLDLKSIYIKPLFYLYLLYLRPLRYLLFGAFALYIAHAHVISLLAGQFLDYR